MSIANIPENNLDFQNGNNIRLAIAGLAICKFADEGSEIKFLRHVDKHQLKLKIIQKSIKGENVGEVEYTIGKTLKTISFAGAETVNGYQYKPGYYSEYELKMMLDLQFLHGHRLDQKPGPHYDNLTVMSIDNCLFYTAKLTDADFDLVRKPSSPLGVKRRFCEILGGYMKVAENSELTITIPGLAASPIKLPAQIDGEKYFYEIQFNNSCFEENGKPCESTVTTEDTDFLKIYDILEDTKRPFEQFDLKNLDAHKGINTGACLPVVEEPCLNCT